MHDLRLKVLRESGKTVSKKARSRPESTRTSSRNSPAGSPAASRPQSPSASRYASENELSDDDNNDSATLDFASVATESDNEEGDEEDDGGDGPPAWHGMLQDRIAELQDRKRSNVKGRETAIASYLHIVKHHYAHDQVGSSSGDIIMALMKSVKSGGSSREKSLALQAVQATLMTNPSDTIYGSIYKLLQSAAEDDDSDDVKISAIQAMAVATLHGGGSEEAAEDFLDFLVGIIESDGEVVGCGDNGDIVTAALQAWAFVASQMDDIRTQVHDALEAFVEQLDSTDVGVQTSAGFNIAFIFEAARDFEQETDETFNLQYDPKRLISRMSQAAKPVAKQTSRKDRRHLRKHFSSIVSSLEHGKGPGYQVSSRPASNPHTGGSKHEDDTTDDFGYHEKVRIGYQVVLINSWSLMARMEVAKNIFGGGFPVHFKRNITVGDLLQDAEVVDMLYADGSKPWKSSKR